MGAWSGRLRSGRRSLVGTNLEGQAIVLPLACRSWRCSCCATRLRARNRARAMMGAQGRVVLVTLTIDPKDPRYASRVWDYLDAGGQGETAPSIRHASWAWNRLSSRLRRRGWSFPYFRGLELHASGRAHVHVVARLSSVSEFFALRNLLRGSWASQAGFGRVVDVQIARSSVEAARYVAKAANAGPVPPAPRMGRMDAGAWRAGAYVTKGLDARMPKYTRRGSWSTTWAPGWTKPTRIAGFSWRVAPVGVELAQAALMLSDFTLSDPAMHRIAASPGDAGGGSAPC